MVTGTDAGLILFYWSWYHAERTFLTSLLKIGVFLDGIPAPAGHCAEPETAGKTPKPRQLHVQSKAWGPVDVMLCTKRVTITVMREDLKLQCTV